MPKKIAPSFYFIGNHSVLDFINTKIAVGGKPVDLLADFSDLLEWLVKARFIIEVEANEYSRTWGSGKEGEAVVTTARALRSALLSLVEQRNAGRDVSEHLEQINGLLRDRVITTKLVQMENGFAEKREVKVRKPTDLLAPIAEAAIEFFSHCEMQLVKKCENPDCVLLFYDQSKNATRRWCSQKTCGNRMKVAAFLERRKNQ
ncbi:CGNR zinc finger domain-containing protein [Paenibacillus sp. sptzw28]|uniref:CGNR zinc finger domain-containing protein n=1 Tax=Paenibacillus sp. sptzw28 TaxID=715179 RepID=UPI001C6F4F0D|nr:ABATE domain-containing protein [Paenibacillus sp. sptzw28]QYR19129.1 CGNR zinc finger domain-containing protein [Paenibacillus sp. sptzw28]